MSHFKGQIIVPDFGFYGREAHVSLLRENRLMAGVKKRRKRAVRYEDAETLARAEHE